MQSTSATADPDVRPRKLAQQPPEEDIVISGIAGRFPESNNMKQLYHNLMSKNDLITDDDRRWKLDHPEIPQRTGKINKIEKFDSLFFGVHFKQAHTMDPMCRMLLEHAYEAVVDAGVNPRTLRGSKTGVFIGACFSESEKTWFYDKLQVNGFGITGCARSMLSNRISYFLGITGPSYTVDTACSSSLFALEHAYRAIREGLCDAAIVGGANLCLHPYVSMQFFKLGVLSVDGRCKTFDEEANGYVRSESIAVIFLQKAKDAKRVYATVVHGKINCDGFKEQGVTFPSSHMQGVLLKEFYLECGIPPSLVSYIEAHGTGTRVGDPEEVNAIDSVFAGDARDSTDPLLIGSVKSNLGHSEPASGLVSIAKVLLAMESGVIPPNINFNRAKEEIGSISEGRIKVVTDATPWKGEFAGVNSFGFGGANAHVLLKRNSKQKVNGGQPNDDLPRLAVVSGRTEDAVSAILTDLESKPVDVEYLRLLHDIHSDDITNHLYRGYTLLPAHGVANFPTREIKQVSGTKRPVWFVFSGMGSQWPGMGEALLRIPVFAQAIEKCDAALKPLGIDIFHVISNKDKKAFDNILHSFVGIAAVQIGLVDVLRSLGIEPDNIIGHSVGELGCAYADGCFTAEQMILAAYSRGLISIETKVIHGSMAAVGLGYKNLKPICPSDIEIACHNAADSATISGPAESMKAFVAELQAKNIFAREVACSNIPYHSRYVAPAGPRLLATLQKLVPSPKQRSSKWLSTSVPVDKWDSPEARYSSAEYHTNNLLGSVLFEEASVFIPKDAIAIEIAPHGLLQAILRRSLAPTVANIPLTQRGHEDNVQVLLQALGKMYNCGLQPQLANLYPAVAYPVSRSTPMISPLIQWEHSEDWYVTNYKSQQNNTSGERIVKVALTDSDYESMAGHVIDGRNLFPATGYLWLIWQTLGMMQGELYIEMSVVFEDVKFLRATQLPKSGEVEFTLMVQKGTGRFEVVEGGAAVVTGFVRSTTTPAAEKIKTTRAPSNEPEVMSSRDIYKELRIRGYHYTGVFCSMRSSTANGLKGQIEWCNDWVAFMDNMLQIKILGTDTRGLFVPTGIKKLIIDTSAHLSQIKFGEQGKKFPVYVDKLNDTIVSGGVEIRGLKSSAIPRRKPAGKPILEEYKFVPFVDAGEASLREVAKVVSQIAVENHMGIKVKTVELISEPDKISPKDVISPLIVESLEDMPLIQAETIILSTKSKFSEEFALPPSISIVDPKKASADANSLMVVGHRLLTDTLADNLGLLLREVKPNGFVLTRENASDASKLDQLAQSRDLTVVLAKRHESHVFVLLRRQEKLRAQIYVVHVNNEKLDWVDDMRKVMAEALKNENTANSRVLLVGQGNFENGLMGLINCLKLEPGGEVVRAVLVQDPRAPKFDLQDPLFASQVKKDLVINVLRENGAWGTYRHVALPPVEPKPVRYGWVNQAVRGDLSSLIWQEGHVQTNKEAKNIVGIYYSSVNFKDVMLATGKLAVEVVAKTRLSAESVIGIEYSGIDSSGRRVMGMMESRGLANLCVGDPDLMWQIPDNWTLEDAATVPCVYATCYYALYQNGQMKKGDKVLIHAGTGGVGQAAIHLALYEGCEVFTTVGTPEKRKFIREHFPQIPDNHIGNSRDTSFEQMIAEQTDGQGVDIVLNSLAEEKLLASVNCLAWGGRFLEIGKFDLSADNPLGMECFLREISFKGIHLDRVMTADSRAKRELQMLMAPGLKNGAIKPLVRTVFPKDHVETAFRYMAAGKHMGKVIIKVREEKEPIDTPISAYPRYYCLADRSYVILGGLGGFGLELADWLVLRGARNLVLTSRSGIKNGFQTMRIEIWKSYGVRVSVVAGKDASVPKDCQSILETAAGLGPVDGIFNLAVVLNDSLWESQTQESFRESLRTKAWATKNLDALSRKLCPGLRHFVVFSSVSCGRGNAGQSNYGMSNSVMERICERRASEGYPALAVQWGAVGDVGLVAEMQMDHKELVIGGTLQQGIFSCLHELDGLMQQKRAVVSSMVVAEKKTSGSGVLSITDTVLNIMGLKDLKGVSPNASLAELGMDSMMSVEIKQTLEREFDVFLTAQDIRGLNFAKLQEMTVEAENAQQQQLNTTSGEVGPDAEQQVNLRPASRLLGDGNVSLETCVRLLTKEESDRSEIFLIPGVEGFASVFMSLASKIRAPATCLQLEINNDCQSIACMSDLLLPHVLERSKNRQDFTLVGYSYGSLLAIELARRLEERGLAGQLILIDGAPEPVKLMQKCYTHNNSDQELQTKAILDIILVLSPAHASNLKTALEKCQKWEEKVEALVQIYPPSRLNMSDENFRNLCKSLYNRIIALQTYSTSNMSPIRAPITLLKPTIPSIQYDADDYGLSQVTKSKVSVYTVPGNHVTMLDNERIASVINGCDVEDTNAFKAEILGKSKKL
ncbi:fatty acid synthase-like [Copidosoma floridanum]|uniref:fatty acid synthase-like n=1 Tax=Copidosoma floridanum TaxID=29053 RepID=UPI0006C96DEC|nr:fatty acid synthase-like [Copidosoma floridanum]